MENHFIDQEKHSTLVFELYNWFGDKGLTPAEANALMNCVKAILLAKGVVELSKE